MSLVESPAIKSYWPATRHPGPCLLFLAPMLLVYELGVLGLGGTEPAALRNGADTWARAGLAAVSVRHPAAVPIIVIGILAVWFWRSRGTTPEDTPTVCLGMALESIVAAMALWGVSRGFAPLLGWLGITVATPPALNAAAMGQVVTYIGAGVYEELLFRMILFGGLCALLVSMGAPGKLSVLAAAIVAAFIFAAAHHIGPHGEPMDSYNFLFRAMAGLYFTALYQFRGFGIAVGAHASYDVLVGIAM